MSVYFLQLHIWYFKKIENKEINHFRVDYISSKMSFFLEQLTRYCVKEILCPRFSYSDHEENLKKAVKAMTVLEQLTKYLADIISGKYPSPKLLIISSK